MRFRPCIDLHGGVVKQIVGSTLADPDPDALKTNFTSRHPPAWYARMYREDRLDGGHVILLGPGNDAAAMEALGTWPGGMQVGGGVTIHNAGQWLDAGASAVIVTSWVFGGGRIDEDRLKRLCRAVGRTRLVLDLSCRKQEKVYRVVTDRWQRFTEMPIDHRLLTRLAGYCGEFLVHGVDVEGKCQGIETPLVRLLGQWAEIPVTYAGGIHTQDDIRTIAHLGRGALDFTVGSALDIFGGTGLTYAELAKRYGPGTPSAEAVPDDPVA